MKMRKPDFYLASTESYAFRGPRSCWVEAQVRGEIRTDYLLIRIDPPATDFFTKEPISRVILAGRTGPTKWDKLPINVYIAKIKDVSILKTHQCNASNMETITTGDIFSTMVEARELADSFEG